MFGLVKQIQSIVNRGLQAVGSAISRVTKPIAHGPALSTVADLARSKPQLVAENLLLRQQLIVLNRSVKRPRFTVPAPSHIRLKKTKDLRAQDDML